MDLQAGTEHRQSLGSAMLLIVLFVAVVAAVVWANLWKRDMKVGDVAVVGNSILTEKEIISLANIDIGQRLYDVDLQSAQDRVKQNGFVRTVSVNREAPSRIIITLEERVPIAGVILGRIEYLDADGVVLPSARSSNIFDLPVLTGTFRSGEFIPGRQVRRSDVREALEILETALVLSEDLYRRISEIHIEQNRDIVFYTAEYGVPVLFGHNDIAMKLVKFDGFWKEIVPHHGAHELSYIDLRFEDQVVVRWNHDAAEAPTEKAVVGKSVKVRKS